MLITTYNLFSERALKNYYFAASHGEQIIIEAAIPSLFALQSHINAHRNKYRILSLNIRRSIIIRWSFATEEFGTGRGIKFTKILAIDLRLYDKHIEAGGG